MEVILKAEAIKNWKIGEDILTLKGLRLWDQIKKRLQKKIITLEELKDVLCQIGGRLNPVWIEWLMGWPLGWTDLKHLETVKYQQ